MIFWNEAKHKFSDYHGKVILKAKEGSEFQQMPHPKKRPQLSQRNKLQT